MTAHYQRCIALLGRRDEPTDALEDYCNRLAEKLRERDCRLELSRVPWIEKGWRQALKELGANLAHWQGSWILVQYTALAWSRRGFPVGFIRTIRILKRAGLHVVVVLHDPGAFGGKRLRDHMRRQIQLGLLRHAAQLSDKIVTTVPPDCVGWMRTPAVQAKTLFIPVGANIARQPGPTTSGQAIPVVLVFGFSQLQAEAALIASVLLRTAAQMGPIHLVIFGRGAKSIETILSPMLQGSQVVLEAFGIVESEEAASLFARTDVQLFIRSGLSSRRGSGIAGIACGVPIVAFSDKDTAFPITEAGVRLVPMGDVDGLVRELVSVLRQPLLRQTLRQQNLEVAERYFSWDRIAEAYVSFLGNP